MGTMTETPQTVSTQRRSHDYHAEAHVLHGELQHPIKQKIEQQAPLTLHDRRGGHITRHAEEVSVEGLISFTKGQTRVSGSRSMKTNGWVTLSTSILEGLNVFEVITADRLVSQVSVEHPYESGHMPHVTFLGTQFTGLRVGGFPVALDLDLGICGDRPPDDRSYLQDRDFLNRVKEQTKKVAKAGGLPKQLKEQYDEKLAYIEQLIRTCDASDQPSHAPITCSLVESIGEIPIPGVQSFGNVLLIPEFGSVKLGEVTVGEEMHEGSTRPAIYFELTTASMKLGCIGGGQVTTTVTKTNGQSYP